MRALPSSELDALCGELRRAILESSAVVGGHVGPNLGVVELTVALHRVFDTPRDRLIFDVSHQTYAHKALTGRAAAFLDPTRYQEVSGFSNPDESPFDLFAMGHTSTSIGLGCGLVKAREIEGETYDVIAVIGDGALSGGLAFEGLDNAADLGCGLIIIVNDNNRSIAENHGGIYRNLAELRRTHGKAQHNFFRALGLDYRYVEEGNDVHALASALESLRGIDHPVVLHVHTLKGAGFPAAVRDPESWHHAAPFTLADGATIPDPHPFAEGSVCYADITGGLLSERIKNDPAVVAISAATPYIMGFTPARRAAAGAGYVDVGICEEHAVTYATALAQAGAKPVFGVYATFLQRAYDELWHDMCLNAAPATILVFGASVFGSSAETHLGFFDLAMLGSLPAMRVLAPVCREEYEAMLRWSLDQREGPVAIRIPETGVISRSDLAPEGSSPSFSAPSYQVARTGGDVAILALGSLFTLGERVADMLAEDHGIRATLVNPRFGSELDEGCLEAIGRDHAVVITIEDGVLDGGWGEKVARYLGPSPARVRCYGIPKRFFDRFDPGELLKRCGMNAPDMVSNVLDMIRAVSKDESGSL